MTHAARLSIYEHCLHQLPIGLVILRLVDLADVDSFQLLEINAIAQHLLGFCDESASTEHFKQLKDPFPALLKIEPPSVYAEVVRSGIAKEMGKVRYRDRQEMVCSIHAFPLADQCLGVLLQDVTQRHQMEESLEAEQARLNGILTLTKEAIIITDNHGCITLFNKGAETMFGYRAIEIMGQPFYRLQLNRQGVPQRSLRHLLHAQPSSVTGHQSEIWCRRKDGIEFPAEVSVSQLELRDELIYTVILRDITERKDAEAALIESEALYRRLFETAQEGILIVDAQSGQIKDANPFILKLLGYNREQLLDKLLWHMGRPTDIEANQAAFHQLQQQGYIRFDDRPLTTHTGQPIEVEFICNTYRTKSQTVIQCNIRDISERKAMEAALKRSYDRLAESNTELEDFAFAASHDLQEPLRKIVTFGERLQTKWGDRLPDDGIDYLNRMQTAARRMQVLIKNLLTFSRVTTQAQPFQPVSLNDVIDGVLSDLEVQIQQVNGKVIVSPLPTIAADSLQMRQLFQNLISNGLKFHKPNVPPQVWIEGTLQTLLPDRANSQAATVCQITVTDNGIGFEERHSDRIFTVFQRLHGRSDYEGMGIGLAICRKIVQRHSGTIIASGSPNQGARFTVTLPISQPLND